MSRWHHKPFRGFVALATSLTDHERGCHWLISSIVSRLRLLDCCWLSTGEIQIACKTNGKRNILTACNHHPRPFDVWRREENSKHTRQLRPLLSSSNTLTARALLGQRGLQKWWCYKFKQSNVVLVLATDYKFNQTKLGRGGGECVEGVCEVWWRFQFYTAKASM